MLYGNLLIPASEISFQPTKLATKSLSSSVENSYDACCNFSVLSRLEVFPNSYPRHKIYLSKTSL